MWRPATLRCLWVRVATLLGLFLSCTFGTAPQAATSSGHPCASLAASPQFRSDRTAFCASRSGTSFDLWRTTDGGESWNKRAATGLGPSPSALGAPRLMLSPRYEADHAIFVGILGGGLYESRDGGDSFTVVHPPFAGSNSRPLVARLGDAPLEAVQRVQFVEARPGQEEGANESVLIDTATHLSTPIKGSPVYDHDFAISPAYEQDGLAFAIGESGVGETEQFHLYGCNELFVCSEELFSLPLTTEFDHLWFAPDFERSKTMFLSGESLRARIQVWQSHDAGVTFQPWKSVQAILDRIRHPKKAGGRVEIALAGVPNTSTMYLRTYYDSTSYDNPRIPSARLFRTDNHGNSWRQIAFGRNPISYKGRHPGTFPAHLVEQPSKYQPDPGAMVAPTKETLLILTSKGDTVSCSNNGGRTWAYRCGPRRR